ncbi:NAD(P)H-dependent oxidoreductase [Phytoactinopolyspora mesophila]|uniref:NADPH-dependent oxidoreductase n=1 Tax=Phytoactinopolyspora mesophila TaxID=2650750 RepID=A0A7K3M6L3_9ACTN|nr:NADPH-dependent oxidoreductase [Phytoactinopolyspora mesophila]
MDRIVNSRASADAPLRTAVIVGSTREGRGGAAIAQWFAECSRQEAALELDVIDLAEFSFPQRYPRRATPAMLDFSKRVDRADAFVVVTPEYNHGYPASLKQAIDYCCDEWFAKPVGFVAYGTAAQGLRAVEQLRQVFNALHTVTIADVVSFNRFDGSLGDDGRPRDTEAAGIAVRRMLAQLTWWARALRAARAELPFAA